MSDTTLARLKSAFWYLAVKISKGLAINVPKAVQNKLAPTNVSGFITPFEITKRAGAFLAADARMDGKNPRNKFVNPAL